MAISITPSPFGSVTVTLDGELGGVLSVSVLATSNSALNMDLGVPGPAGEQGEPGANGQNGVGVPVGGTAGQVLAKIDGTNYNTEWVDAGAAGDFLPLAGGTMTGTIFLPSLRNLLNTDLTVTAYNDTGAGTNFVHTFDAYDGTFALATNGGGLKFPDSTVQVTAYDPAVLGNYLPLTGGTVTGSVTLFEEESNLVLTVVNNYNASTEIYGGEIQMHDGASTIYLRPDGIEFPDSTIQTTAFPGYGGTTSQYIRGDGSVATYGPLGDRYFTTSNSTLTCDSGNGKTMTIGTGLSYSRQQDITVSYNNSNHMHGTVLTYDSATGIMTFDSNTHSGGGTYSSWEVNVGGVAGAVLPVGGTSGQVLAKINSTNFNTEWISLGSMANETATDYLAKAGNLSGLASTSTARTNLGLGTMSTATATDYLAKADNLSGLASTSTARTNLGLGAVSTDAYATNLQAVQNTSTTTVLSPANSRFTGISTNVWSPGVDRLSSATGGSGASASSTVTSLNGALVSASASTAGYATRGFNLFYPSNSVTSGYNYGTESGHSVRVYANWNTTVTGVKLRSVFGRMSAALPVPTTLAARGYGWEYDYSTKVISIIAHNGTSLTTTAQTWASTANRTYDIAVYSNGAGTISLYIDGTLIGTGTGGPSTTSNTGQIWWQLEIENQSTAASQQTIYYQNPKVITTNG